MLIFYIDSFGNHFIVLLAVLTNKSIIGTSTKTPTIAANATPGFKGNRAIATATESSKKLLAPIIAAGAATSCGSFNSFAPPYPIKNIKMV